MGKVIYMILKTIVALALVAAVLVSAFLWYNSRGEDAVVGEKTEPQNTDTAEFRKILSGLRTLKLDTDFFADPVYKSLIDPNVLISRPAIYGRSNPFVPIGVVKVAPQR